MRRLLTNLIAVTAVGAVCVSGLLHAAAASLAEAAMQGDRDLVRALLKNGADVNSSQADGMSALHWAAVKDEADIARMLLYAGANTKATTRLGGYTPLLLAAKNGHVAMVETLLAGGADPNAATTTGTTPLMLVAASGQADAVKRLLDRGAAVNAKEHARGETALTYAAAYGRADAIRALTSGGADVSVATKVVDLADFTREQEEQFGAQGRGGRGGPQVRTVAGVSRRYMLNELVGTQGGLTPLLIAARQGQVESVQALLDAGADINQPGAGDRTTPLLIAIINGRFDLARALLDKGADPTRASDNGVTPVYAVVNCQWAPRALYPQPRAYEQQQITYLDLIDALLRKGADPNARLRRKVWYSGYNTDFSGVDEEGATPFWRAAYASDVDAMKRLVARGADPNIATARTPGRSRSAEVPPDDMREISTLPPVPVGGPAVTPLQAAAGVGYGDGFAGNSHRFAPGGMLAAVKYLIEELHQDVNATDQDGNTALHHAAARGDNEMILYLVSKGANVRAVTRTGRTTVDMANGPVQRVEPFPETIALLEKLGAKNNHKCISC
jgi:ankyrin repeat protein